MGARPAGVHGGGAPDAPRRPRALTRGPRMQPYARRPNPFLRPSVGAAVCTGGWISIDASSAAAHRALVAGVTAARLHFRSPFSAAPCPTASMEISWLTEPRARLRDSHYPSCGWPAEPRGQRHAECQNRLRAGGGYQSPVRGATRELLGFRKHSRGSSEGRAPGAVTADALRAFPPSPSRGCRALASERARAAGVKGPEVWSEMRRKLKGAASRAGGRGVGSQ